MAIVMGREELSPMVQQAAQKYGIPANLIHAVIQRESSGRPTAASGTGPVGLMQISNSLAKQYGYNPKDRLDPSKNIDMGARYIADNLKAFNGDVQKAMVGYSEGTNGAKQMFAGKRDFTPQAKDSMTHKLFTPFYSDDQRANIDARRVGNPMGALQDVQQNDQFNPNNLDRDQAAVAPTQADVMAAQAGGALSGNTALHPVQVPTSPYYSDDTQAGADQTPDQDWSKAALGLAAMLARKKKVNTIEQASRPSAGASAYSPQTQTVLRMLSGLGTNIYK